jgi:cobyrinic acid a,c-diamide synthase
VTIAERHLGLEVPVDTKFEASKRLDTLSMLVETHVQLDLLLDIARREAKQSYERCKGQATLSSQQIDRVQNVRIPYIYIYIYMYVYTNIYICIYIYIYIFIYI